MKALSYFTMMLLFSFSAFSQTAFPIEGRWDLTVDQGSIMA
jgi:hypothetical protein